MKFADIHSHHRATIREMRRNELVRALDGRPIHRLKLACERALRREHVEFLVTGQVVYDQAAVMRKATWWFERLERIAARRKP